MVYDNIFTDKITLKKDEAAIIFRKDGICFAFNKKLIGKEDLVPQTAVLALIISGLLVGGDEDFKSLIERENEQIEHLFEELDNAITTH
jgi:hypothetical protein